MSPERVVTFISHALSGFIVAVAGVVAVSAVVAAAASAWPAPESAPGDVLDPRTYEPASRLYLVLYAAGVQKYTCQANGTWLFTDPEATLYKTTGARKPIGRHFLNFSTGRPVWQLESSTVEAARTQSASGGAGNIAWLLLRTVATTPGRLGHTTWIQRLNTSGGVAPTGICTPGATTAVPYTAQYFFWRESG